MSTAHRSIASRLSLAFLACLAVLLTACGDGNSLTSTLGPNYSLSFDTVDVHQTASDFRITYTSNSNIVATLVYTSTSIASIPINQAITLNFSSTGNAMFSGPTAADLAFPAAMSGNLTFTTTLVGLMAGDTVNGSFLINFVTGKTLNGSFSAPLTVTNSMQ